MDKLKLIILFFFIITTTVNCTQCFSVTQDDKLSENQKMITAILSSMGNVASYSADYEVYNYGELVFVGTIEYRKPNLYKKIHHPPQNVNYEVIEICDGTYRWRYTKAFNSVVKTSQGNEIDFATAQNSLSYRDIYNILYQGDAMLNDEKNHKLLMEDKKTSGSHEDFFKALFTVKDNGLISKIEYYDKEGNVDIMVTFKNYSTNINIPDSEFIFKIPEGAIVNDLTNANGENISKIRGWISKQ